MISGDGDILLFNKDITLKGLSSKEDKTMVLGMLPSEMEAKS